MRFRPLSLLKILPLALFGLCLPAAAAQSPAEVAEAFFTDRLATGTPGSPGGMELAGYSSHLGPELVCLLGAANRFSLGHAHTHPEAPAPFAEGDLYSGAAGLPARFSLGQATIKGERATLPARFEYTDGSHRDDTLRMAIHKRHWVIQNIEFSQAPESGLKAPDLIAALRTQLEKSDASVGWDARALDGCPKGDELARLQAGKKKKTAKKNSSKKSVAKAGSTKKPASKASTRRK